MNLSKIIATFEQQTAFIHKELYNQTLSTHIAYTDLGIVTRAPRIVDLIADNIEALEVHNKRLERLKLKQRYFTEYIDSLPKMTRESLKQGVYDKALEEELLNEIEEIETAVCFRYGIEPPVYEKVETTGDLFEDIALMASVF